MIVARCAMLLYIRRSSLMSRNERAIVPRVPVHWNTDEAYVTLKGDAVRHNIGEDY